MAVTKQTAIKGGAGAVAAAIIASVLAIEGGWVNNPADPGGETNYGVTNAVAQQHRETLVRDYKWDGKMRNLTKEMATSIYYKDYIERPGFNRLLTVSPAVAEKLVDAGVNAGTSRSGRWFQESLNAVSRDGKDYPKIGTDGKVGPATLAAYQALQRKRGAVVACKMVIKMMDGKQTTHYLSLNMHEFTAGWIINRIGNVPLESCNDDNLQ